MTTPTTTLGEIGNSTEKAEQVSQMVKGAGVVNWRRYPEIVNRIAAQIANANGAM